MTLLPIRLYESKYRVVEQIVEMGGGGIKSPKGLDVGPLWLGKRLTETKHCEFTTCSLRAGGGIMVTTRMSPEATGAMWHDALVTKTEQRKNFGQILSWVG
jgi:hypothetical protein